jgi:hypothetical protein
MTRNAVFSSGAALATALIATAAFSSPAYAQGQTRTLDDLRAEYRAQCGKNGSRERLLVAYDRAIRIASGPASRKQLTAQRAAVANPREPICPEPPKPLTAGTSSTPAAATGEGDVEDVCQRPAPNPRARDCAAFRLLLGRWSGGPRGGAVELVLTPDGTISGTIVSDSKWMREYGYRAGMQILRGWQPRGYRSGSWLVAALNGESFSAAKPGCKPVEACGRARWAKGGVLSISKATPDLTYFPNDMGLNNSEKFRRMAGQ